MNKMTLAIIGVAFVAILSFGYAGYTSLNRHQMTMTRQVVVTNMQSMNIIQTTTVVRTTTSSATMTPIPANGNAYNQNCGNNFGCNPPYTYDACSMTGSGNSVQCDGYIYQDQNGCIELSVPTYINADAYNHYTLLNLPSSYPPVGSWVIVKGQLFQGSNSSLTGTSCPLNYITVSSIQPTNLPPS